MGQKQNSSNGRRSNHGRHFKGQGLCWLALTLATSVACAPSAPEAASKTPTPTPTTVSNIEAAVAEDAPAFDQSKAWVHLTKQVDFGFRVPGTEPHKACRDYIEDQLKNSCDDVHLQELTHTWTRTKKPVTMWNIIGEQNWKTAKTHVVLLAHWDTRPSAEQDVDPANHLKPIPGANDGASGVAVLLELARVMKGHLPKDLGVMYLMTDGEDLGPDLDEMFLGAEYFAKHLPSPKPDYGILLDMIGDKDLAVPLEPNSVGASNHLEFDFFRNAANAGLGKYFPMIEGPEIEDDHLSLIEAGVPTIDLIDFNYPSWHTLQDTPDKCSAASLGVIGKALQTWLEKDPPYELPK